jgi:tRNA(adenine34) deaminase
MDPSALDPFQSRASPEELMRLALREAERAEEAGEVPVGAILVENASGRILARAHNQRELLRDPTAHAEILAITQGAAHYDAWRLSRVSLVVTLEPCLMCAGAIILARIPRVIYGADDPKAGAFRSLHSVLVHPGNNHRPEVLPGILANECGLILKRFFQRQRAEKREPGDAD